MTKAATGWADARCETWDRCYDGGWQGLIVPDAFLPAGGRDKDESPSKVPIATDN